MKYDITFSCGHTGTITLYGKNEDRERKLEYYKREGLCKKCFQLQKNDPDSKTIRIKYKEYKENYLEFKAMPDSYDPITKTIEIKVPKNSFEDDRFKN